MLQLIDERQIRRNVIEDRVKQFIQRRRCETLPFLATFHDDVVVASGVNLDVGAGEIFCITKRRQLLVRRANGFRASANLSLDLWQCQH